MSPEARGLAATILIVYPTVLYGGVFLLSQLRARKPGYVDNPLRRGFYTAGHAHAGVLLILSLVIQFIADQTTLASPFNWLARSGVPVAAILMPAGFFLSVTGTSERPNRLVLLIYVGGLLLAASFLTLGIGLLTTSAPAA